MDSRKELRRKQILQDTGHHVPDEGLVGDVCRSSASSTFSPIRHILPQIPTRAGNPKMAVSKASLREGNRAGDDTVMNLILPYKTEHDTSSGPSTEDSEGGLEDALCQRGSRALCEDIGNTSSDILESFAVSGGASGLSSSSGIDRNSDQRTTTQSPVQAPPSPSEFLLKIDQYPSTTVDSTAKPSVLQESTFSPETSSPDDTHMYPGLPDAVGKTPTEPQIERSKLTAEQSATASRTTPDVRRPATDDIFQQNSPPVPDISLKGTARRQTPEHGQQRAVYSRANDKNKTQDPVVGPVQYFEQQQAVFGRSHEMSEEQQQYLAKLFKPFGSIVEDSNKVPQQAAKSSRSTEPAGYKRASKSAHEPSLNTFERQRNPFNVAHEGSPRTNEPLVGHFGPARGTFGSFESMGESGRAAPGHFDRHARQAFDLGPGTTGHQRMPFEINREAARRMERFETREFPFMTSNFPGQQQMLGAGATDDRGGFSKYSDSVIDWAGRSPRHGKNSSKSEAPRHLLPGGPPATDVGHRSVSAWAAGGTDEAMNLTLAVKNSQGSAPQPRVKSPHSGTSHLSSGRAQNSPLDAIMKMTSRIEHVEGQQLTPLSTDRYGFDSGLDLFKELPAAHSMSSQQPVGMFPKVQFGEGAHRKQALTHAAGSAAEQHEAQPADVVVHSPHGLKVSEETKLGIGKPSSDVISSPAAQPHSTDANPIRLKIRRSLEGSHEISVVSSLSPAEQKSVAVDLPSVPSTAHTDQQSQKAEPPVAADCQDRPVRKPVCEDISSTYTDHPSPLALSLLGATTGTTAKSKTKAGGAGRAKTKGELKKQLFERREQRLRVEGSQASSPAGSTLTPSPSYSHTDTLSPLSVHVDGASTTPQASPLLTDIKTTTSTVPPIKSTSTIVDEPVNKDNESRETAEWLIGDMLWAKVSGHPWWPCMVSPDPQLDVFYKKTKRRPNSIQWQYHVRFYGDENERGWVPDTSVIKFEGRGAFDDYCERMVREHRRDRKSFAVNASRRKAWDIAVATAEQAFKLPIEERVKLWDSDEQQQNPVEQKLSAEDTTPEHKNSDAKQKRARKHTAHNGNSSTADTQLEKVEPCDTEADKQVEKPAGKQARRKSGQKPADDAPKGAGDSEAKRSRRQSRRTLVEASAPTDGQLPEVSGDADRLHVTDSVEHGSVDGRGAGDSKLVTGKKAKEIGESVETQAEMAAISSDDVATAAAATAAGAAAAGGAGAKTVHDVLKKESAQFAVFCQKRRVSVRADNPQLSDDDIDALLFDQWRQLDNKTKSRFIPMGSDVIHLSEVKLSSTAPSDVETKRSSRLSGHQVKDKSQNVETTDNSHTTKLERTETESAEANRELRPRSSTSKTVNNETVEHHKRKSEVVATKQLKSSDVPPKKRSHKSVDTETVDNTSVDDVDIDKQLKEPAASPVLPGCAVGVDFETDVEMCPACKQVVLPTEKSCVCAGTCRRIFHAACADQTTAAAAVDNTFTCKHCTEGKHVCFGCKLDTCDSPVVQCSVDSCRHFYHTLCINNDHVCPLHRCATCKQSTLMSVRYFECIQCPTAYHATANLQCLAAGSVQVAGRYIICPQHFQRIKSNAHHSRIHINWCCVCEQVDDLVGCDVCPLSYHKLCLTPSHRESKSVQRCPSCHAGRVPLYGDMVWVKFGSYRWWPGQICFPDEIPTNILERSHQVGEFVVCFYGSHDYLWTHHGRVIPYNNKDKSCREYSSLSRGAPKDFAAAITEAKLKYKSKQQKSMSDDDPSGVKLTPSPAAVTAAIETANTPAHVKSAHGKSAHGKPAHVTPAHVKSAHVTPAHVTPVDVTPVDVTPAHSPAHRVTDSSDQPTILFEAMLPVATESPVDWISETRSLATDCRSEIVEHGDGVVCFYCGQPGRLLWCDKLKCGKAYHMTCLEIYKLPHGVWLCPWHHCAVCARAAVSMCSLCPVAYCAEHVCDNLRLTAAYQVVCCNHTDVLTGDESSLFPWIGVCATKSAKKQKRQNRRKSSDVRASCSDTVSDIGDATPGQTDKRETSRHSATTQRKSKSGEHKTNSRNKQRVERHRRVEDSETKRQLPRRKTHGDDVEARDIEQDNKCSDTEPINTEAGAKKKKANVKSSKASEKDSKVSRKQNDKRTKTTPSHDESGVRREHCKTVVDGSEKQKTTLSAQLKDKTSRRAKKRKLEHDEDELSRQHKKKRRVKSASHRAAVELSSDSETDSVKRWSAVTMNRTRGSTLSQVFDSVSNQLSTVGLKASKPPGASPAAAAAAAATAPKQTVVDEPLFDNSDDDFPQLVIDVPTI